MLPVDLFTLRKMRTELPRQFLRSSSSTPSQTPRGCIGSRKSQADLEVKKESLDAAERLYQDTRNEVERGAQAPVDLTSALAQVASNRQAYISVQGMVLQQELLLKEVLTAKGFQILSWPPPVLPR